MKKHILTIFILILTVFSLYGCYKPVEIERNAGFYKEEGDNYRKNGNYRRAIKAYENALTRAENPETAAVIQIALADSHFFNKDYNEAIPIYETYLDVYSEAPGADTAVLRIGLSHYNLIRRAERDQTDSLAAVKYFNMLKERNFELFEDNDLEKKIKEIYEIQAKKELYIGRYYARILKRKQAIGRFKYLLENYPDSKVYAEGCWQLIKNLVKEGKKEEANSYYLILKEKRPYDKYVKKSEKLINKK